MPVILPENQTNTRGNIEKNYPKVTTDFYCPVADESLMVALNKKKELIKHDWHYQLFSTGNSCSSGEKVACIEKNAEHKINQYKLYCNYTNARYQIGYLWYASKDCKIIGNDGFKGCQYIV